MALSFKDNDASVKFILEDLSHNTNLSDWEKGFIKDVKKYNSRGGFLSDKQKETLSKIWEKY